MTWPAGNCYEGSFKMNNRHGRGVMTGADGSRKEGYWRDDSYLGTGGQKKSVELIAAFRQFVLRKRTRNRSPGGSPYAAPSKHT
jgi:hypothetical protein